jgi:GTPase SAR1 family protein
MSSALTPPPAPAGTLDPAAVRIVLFGMPDAGKSSLLGALAQAAHSQGRTLRGHLTDLTHGLAELRRRVYEDRQTETREEIVPYPVRFTPAGKSSFPAILFDCDGRVANDFLTQKRALEHGRKAGPLAEAILSADALILTVDVSASDEQMEQDFREFHRFLVHLERHRKREHAVGGFPVFLVLTKCDNLARERMTRATWEAKIAERRMEVGGRFKKFLAEAGPDQPAMLTFGTIDMEVRSTAVRRPELADASAQLHEPYGVAELFHDAFAEALAFRQRRTRSERRLRWTIAGAGGFFGAMLLAGAIFFLSSGKAPPLTLSDRVDALLAAEGRDPATRLGPGVDHRLREWLEIHSDPGFATLPPEQQDIVRRRLDEEQAYIQFRDALAAIPPPNQARSLPELGQIEARLAKLTPPDPYRDEWGPTDAMQLRDRMLTKEIPALRSAVGQLTQYFFNLKNRAGNSLNQAADLNAEWEQRVRSLGDAAEKNLPVPRADPALGAAFAYDEVALAEGDWERTYRRLKHVREMASALGLIGDPAGPRAPLAPAEPPPDANIAELASRRWQNLKTHYPDYARWSLGDVPDVVRPEIERRLRRSLEQSYRDGRRLILDRLKAINPTGREIAADWPRVAEYLLSAPLQDWRELTAFIAKLADPSADDPVLATASFLRRESFDLDVRKVRLRIPDTLSDAIVRPAGDLVLVYRKSEGGESVRVTLRPDGDPQRDKQTMVYQFTAAGDPRLTYRPGDTFSAELPVRKGDRDMRLTWSEPRAQSFQFEALVREPRLHAADQSPREVLTAEGVTTEVTDGKFAAVPPLVPLVRLEMK